MTKFYLSKIVYNRNRRAFPPTLKNPPGEKGNHLPREHMHHSSSSGDAQNFKKKTNAGN